MSNASSPFRARVVPIIKILDGSQSEPVEGRSGRVYGWSGAGETSERCTVFPNKLTTPAQVEQWLKDVAGGALDDIFQVPFRRFGAYVPAFRLETWEETSEPVAGPCVTCGNEHSGTECPPTAPHPGDELPPVDESVTPADPDTLPATESTKDAAESAELVDVDRDEMGEPLEEKPAEAPRGRGRPPKAK
jgi:hypothetical protein